MNIEQIFRNRCVIQDEEFSQEFFTQIFPEMLWDDYDKAMEFLSKLILLHDKIVKTFTDVEISENNLYFTCVGKTVFFNHNKDITPKTINNYNLNFLNKLKES